MLLQHTQFGSNFGDDQPSSQQQGAGQLEDFDLKLACEIESGENYILEVQQSWFDQQIQSGSIHSGFTQLAVPPGSMINDDAYLIKVEGEPEMTTYDPLERRRLAVTQGTKSVLIVRVQSSDSRPTNTLGQMSYSVFGNHDLSFANQYRACSHNKLNFVRAPNRQGTNARIKNGNAYIFLSDVSTSNGDSAMRNAVTRELERKFGVSHPTVLADHVMYCFPPGTFDGVAYAYVNSWNSVYNDEWCVKLSAQMHEIGKWESFCKTWLLHGSN